MLGEQLNTLRSLEIELLFASNQTQIAEQWLHWPPTLRRASQLQKIPEKPHF